MNRKGQIGIFIIFLSSMGVVQCYSFDDYVIEFGKAYKTKEQYDFRKEIFEANYSKITQSNLNNQSNQLSPTTWTDRTLNQTESVLSFKPDINAVGSAIPTEQLKVSAPRMIDWRYFRAVSRIKDQGYCGSCWAFAAVAAFQSYVAIRTFQLHDLAQQSLLQCTPGSSCYGGSIQTSMSRAATYGLPSQSSYLYSAKYSSTNSYSKYPGICNASSVIRLPNNSRTSVYVNLTHQQMKTQIAASPMAIAIAVNYEFMQFRGKGVFSCRRNVTWWELNHAVEVVGYDWDGNYIIKNSWGTMWGDMGYIVLNKTFSCGVGMYSVQYTRNTQINNTNTTNATTSTESTSNSTEPASNSTGSLTNNSAFRNFLCFAIPILLIMLTF